MDRPGPPDGGPVLLLSLADEALRQWGERDFKTIQLVYDELSEQGYTSLPRRYQKSDALQDQH